MSRRKQARPRLCKRDDEEDDDDNAEYEDVADAKKKKLSEDTTIKEEIKVKMAGDFEGAEPEVFRCESCGATFENLMHFMDHRNYQCETGVLPYQPRSESRSGTPSSVDSAGSHPGSTDSLIDRLDPDQVPCHIGVDDDHPIPCQFCDKAFSKISYLKVHEQVHVDMLPFSCRFCPRLFRHKRSRDRHVKLHTGDKKFKCNQCDAAFARSDHLKSHEKSHTSEESYRCPVCSLDYPTMAALMSHQNAHKPKTNSQATSSKLDSTAKFNVKCLECEEMFYSEKEMSRHNCGRSSGKKTTFQCQQCTAICIGQTALNLHMEHAHSGDTVNQNKCPMCYKSFLNMDELMAHMKVHDLMNTDLSSADTMITAGDIPALEFGGLISQSTTNNGICPTDILVCPYCLRDNFETLEALEVHMQSVHSVKPTEVYTCNYCNAPYKNLYSLHEHMRAIHQNQPSMGIKYPCSRCGKEYPSIEALQEHKKRAHFKHKHSDTSHACPHCFVTFVSNSSLQEHIRLVHSDSVMKPKDEISPRTTKTVGRPPKFASPKPKEIGFPPLSEPGNPMIINVPEPSHLLRHLKSPLKNNFHSPTSTIHHNPTPGGSHTQMSMDTSSSGRNEIQEKITCDQCNAGFPDLMTFQAHMKLHLESVLGQYACRQCNKLFLSEDQLESHISSHYLLALSEYGCTSCNKTFHKPDELQKHLMDIHAHHLYKCSLCKDVFDSKVNIQVHFAIKHSNETKLFKCVTCDSVFRSESEWQVHLRVTHLQVAKPYRCLFCKESFKSEMDLQCHLATHNKPFKCSMCDESFLVEFLLDKHLQSVHSSGAGNPSGASPRSVTESGENSYTSVKLEKDLDAIKQESLPVGSSSSSSLYSQLLSPAGNHANLLLGNNGLLGDGMYGGLMSGAGVGSMVWKSPDDLYRCNICDMKFSQVSGLQTHKLQDHGVKYSSIKSPFSPSSSPKQSPNSSADTPTSRYSPAAMTLPTIADISMLTSDKRSTSVLQDALQASTMSLPLNIPESQQNTVAFTEKLVSTLGEKISLACPFCSQTFKGKSELEKHSKIHLNTGSQKCNICDEVFESSGILAEHKLTHCKIQQGNVCVVCKIGIKTEDQFYLHSQEHGFQGAVMQCIVCRQTLASMLELQMHARHHFQTKSSFYTCCVCLKSFDTNENMISKLNSSGRTYYVCKPCYHGERNEYPCTQCSMTFDSASSLEVHLVSHKKSYQCIKCQEWFKSEQEIQIHVATHMITEGNVHECKLCLIVLDSPAKLQCHLIEHTYKTGEYRCSICGQSFETATEIQCHALEHGLTARRYGCSQCSQKFFFSAELENHLYVHKGTIDQSMTKKSHNSQSLTIQPLSSYSLDEFKFQSQSSVVSKAVNQSKSSSFLHSQSGLHKSVHDDIRCTHCDASFLSVQDLTSHYKRSHGDEKGKLLQCSSCQEVFPNVSLLQIHFFSTHTMSDVEYTKIKPKCTECGKECSSENNLLTHLSTHVKGGSKLSCPVCDRAFSSTTSLTAHLKSNCGNKSFECPICHKRFTKKSSKMEHMKSHSGDKVYPCSYCGKLFSGRASVREHMAVHKTGTASCGTLEDDNQTGSLSGTSDATPPASAGHSDVDDLSDLEKEEMKQEVTSTSNIAEDTSTPPAQ